MKKALKLAKKGGLRVHTNPLVGCVIVKKGKIAGTGWHEYFGGPHAEINALKNAGKNASGATMYVTLEPCSTYGKTPPCTESIIQSGINRVVAAMADPNPVNKNSGFSKLRKAGIKVVSGVLYKDAKIMNRRYIYFLRNRKTYVLVKAAMSLDGKIASRTGDSKWISSENSRRFVHILRSKMDAVLVGVNTVIKDNPELTSHGKGRNPVRVVIDPNLRIPLNSKVLDGTVPSYLIYSKAPKRPIARLSGLKNVHLLKINCKNNMISLKDVINKLTNLSIYRILIEGGGETIAAALESKIVNEIMLFIAPIIIGGRKALTPVEGSGAEKISKSLRLNSIKIRRMGKDILLSAKLK